MYTYILNRAFFEQAFFAYIQGTCLLCVVIFYDYHLWWALLYAYIQMICIHTKRWINFFRVHSWRVYVLNMVFTSFYGFTFCEHLQSLPVIVCAVTSTCLLLPRGRVGVREQSQPCYRRQRCKPAARWSTRHSSPCCWKFSNSQPYRIVVVVHSDVFHRHVGRHSPKVSYTVSYIQTSFIAVLLGILQ